MSQSKILFPQYLHTISITNYIYPFQTTKLTGLAVEQNPRHRLLLLYNRVLGLLQRIPENAAYRKHTEELIRHRQRIVESVSIYYDNSGAINT